MEKPLLLCVLFLGLDIFEECSGYPVDLHSQGLRNAELWTSVAPFLALAFLVCSVVLLAGCLCCRQTKGFQEFTDSTSSHSLSGTGGYVNNAASTTEFTIFPPPASNVQQQRLSVAGQTPGDRSSVVRFEPLPDIKPPPQPVSRRPAAFNNAVSHGLSAQDWFEDPHANFPRHQLKYLRELGRGWFGRAVEGEAQGIIPGEKTSKVVVKILHEDATATDHMYFLHEVKPYRDLKHPNILKLLGRCLETDPFLVLLEACPSGDLKSFLSQNISTAEALSQQGMTLLMGCNIASGLQHMHQNGFVHTDLAARNCLVTSDLTIKIGDYGTSIENFKDDYYCAGEVALPIRWCAPETLFCTETTIETKEVTPGANVWNLGVVLWEICEFGKLPYSEFTDDEVIVKVLGEGSHRLGLPSRSCLHRHNLYHLMRLCWSPASQRPALPQVLLMLNHLYSNHEYANQDGDDIYNLKADEDFDRRWETFKPNSIPKTDNHLVNSSSSVVQSPSTEESSIIPPVHVADNLEAEIDKEDQFLNEPKKLFILSQPTFDSIVIPPQDSSTPLTTSPQPSLTSSTGGEFFVPTLQLRHKSPSLQNLRGSLDDLCECNGELNDIGEDITEMSPERTETLKDREQRMGNDNVVIEEEASKLMTSALGARLPEESIGTMISEPEFDSWLQGVETADEEDAKFVRKISEAIRDLDNALALEKTSSSSSSSEASSNTASHHQSPAKEITPITLDQNVVLDFRLGPSSSHTPSGMFSSKEVSFQLDSLQDDSLLEKSLPREGNRATDSGTDTEDEMWRRRVECGEFSAKVKEKSKSIADLMVLTHIECSDGSDSDPPSPSWGFERNLNSKDLFSVRRGSSNKTYNLNTNSGLSFGSEGNIHHAVLGEEFRHTLMKLQEARRDTKNVMVQHQEVFENDSLLAKTNPVLSSVDPKTTLFPSHHNEESDFLDIDASEIPKPSLEEVLCQSVFSVDSLQNDRLLSESLLGSERNEFKVVQSNVGIEHRSKVPEVETLCDSEVKHNGQDVESVCNDKNRNDCVENDLRVEDSCENVPLNAMSDVNTYSNIPFSEAVVASNNPFSAKIHNDEQIFSSVPISQTSEMKTALSGISTELPHPENISGADLHVNNDESITSESINCSDISLFAPSDIFSELNDSELLDSNDFLNIFVGSPSEQNFFSPHPEHTSTPQNGNALCSVNPERSVENKNVKRNLEFQEPVSEILSDHDAVFSFSSINPSDSSYIDSVSGSAIAQNSSAFGTSSDSFDFIPNTEDSHNESSTNFKPLRTEVNFSTDNCRESNFLSSRPVDTEASVILGPCEDYTLDYFKGLKTTSEDIPVRDFDVEETSSEPLFCDISESVENNLEEGSIACQKPLGDKSSDFSDVITSTENDYEKEINISMLPFQEDISLLGNNDGSFVDDTRLLTLSFLEKEIWAENSSREFSPTDSSCAPSEILYKIESIDNHQENLDDSLHEKQLVSDDILQDRLKNIESDLCVPSLNFIAATPVPSGRNSPELLAVSANESNKEIGVNDPEISVTFSDLCEMNSDPAVTHTSSTFLKNSSEITEEPANSTSSPLAENMVNISFLFNDELLCKDIANEQKGVSSNDSICGINGNKSLVSECTELAHSSPGKEMDESMNLEKPKKEDIVNTLLSSLADLSAESKLQEIALNVCEVDSITEKDVELKYEDISSSDVPPCEDLLSPSDDNTKDSVSEMISESFSTVKSNLYECDTIQNSPDVVESHILSFVPEEELHKESEPSKGNPCEGNPTNSSSIVQPTSNETDILQCHGTNSSVSLLDINEGLQKKPGTLLNSENTALTEVLSPKINSESIDSSEKCVQGNSENLQHFVESTSNVKGSTVYEELSVNKEIFEEALLNIHDSNFDNDLFKNSDVTGNTTELFSKISNSHEMVPESTTPFVLDGISSLSEDKTLNNGRTSSSDSVSNDALIARSPLPKDLTQKHVSDQVSSLAVNEKQLSISSIPQQYHNTSESHLPINILSKDCLSVLQKPDFDANPVISEKVRITSEPEQFCFTEGMDIFVKDIPGKTDIAVEKWKQQNIEILAEDFFQTSLDGKPYGNNLLPVTSDIGSHDFSTRFHVEESETAVDLDDDDGEDFGLDVAKHSTPDDERSSDSGFRDKGSLSESCEDACDEKYNLEDIEAELEETFNKGGFNYVVKGIDGEDDDLDHHHGGTDTSEDFRQSETPDGELDSTSSPTGMCGKISPVNQDDTTFNFGQKDNQLCDKTLVEKTVQESTVDFGSESSLLKPGIQSLLVNNLNDLNSKSDVNEILLPNQEELKYHTTETPDLLNIETSDIPMPDLTVDQRKNLGEGLEIMLPDKTANHPEHSDFHLHSDFSQKKDFILDIGQTEFRAFSPECNTDSFLDNSDLSPIRHLGGWFLHPRHNSVEGNDVKHNLEENNAVGDLMDDVFMSPKSTSSTTSNGSKGDENNVNDNHYHPFNLDEEFVAAIRSELQEKLPCARQHSHDEEPEDDGIIDPEDDLSQEERTDITIHYNVYPPPLSPILEERESVSSITTTISDNFCPFIPTPLETSKQDSDSEPGSPVFILDSSDPCTREADAQRFEQEIREALENCSLSSAETDSSSDRGHRKSSVFVEDLEQPSSDQEHTKHSSVNVTVVRDTFPQSDFDDDFLVVDTETNHATLLESPKPKSYLAFVNKRPAQINGVTSETIAPADSLNEKLAVSNSSNGSFFLHAKKYNDLSGISGNEKILSDDEAFTPDSISPGHDQRIHSSSSLLSSDADNPSGNFSISDDPASARNEPGLQQVPAAYNPYFGSSLATHHSNSQGPIYDVVEEIALGLPNNEAAEIISELESSGIFNSLGKESVQNDFSHEPSQESSRTNTETDSEALSQEDNSDSLKSTSSLSTHLDKKNLSLALPTFEQYREQNISEGNGSESENVPLSSVSIQLEESTGEMTSPTRLLNDTLDLYKKKKASQKNDLSPTSEDKDWSVTSLEAALLSTKAPMPSPEEESWKQIPSMLAFSDLNEVISRCGDEDGRFGEAMFGGATSPTYPLPENDDDLMSTSFSLKGDSDDLADCYTPDWESESEDTNEDDNNSSSSGEFIWKDGDREASVKAVDISASNSTSKPYEGLSDFAMEVIAEEEEEEDDEDEEDGSTSSGSGTEFVPSAWNSEATPNRSALRSPDKKVEQKKNVSFKKQKYHCVYEYPREVSDSESDGLDSPSRRRWELYQPDVDYASYADWELMEGDVPETANPDADAEPEVAESQGQSPQTFDFYKLSDVDYDFSSGVMPEDGEFYVSSSARPFQFSAADSDVFSGNGSQFFPGQLYRAANVEDCSGDTTATSVHNKISTLGVSVDSCEDEVDTSVPALSNSNKSSALLDSQNSKENNEMTVEANAAENKSASSKHIKETSHKNSTVELTQVLDSESSEGIEHSSVPDSKDRAKMPVSSAALTSRLNALPFSHDALDGKSQISPVKVESNTEKELDYVETPSPSSPMSPTSGLGELRHTRDRLKLDLPVSGSAFILDPPTSNKRRSVEAVKGEASLLDSGEETEDSGIESSNGITAISKKSQHSEVL